MSSKLEIITTILSALSMPGEHADPMKWADKEGIGCTAQVIYNEARSEGAHCMGVIAHVVHTRMALGYKGNALCEVTAHPYQFASNVPMIDGYPDSRAWLQALEISTLVHVGALDKYGVSTEEPTHFYSGDYGAKPESWSEIKTFVGYECGHNFWK